MATTNSKTILIKEGVTQGELSLKSGVKAIGPIVNGKRIPAPVTANKILKALNAMPNISKQYELHELFPTLK